MVEPDSTQRIEILSNGQVSPALDAAIRALLCECFPQHREDFAGCRWWHESVPRYVALCRRENRLAAHVAMVLREIAVAGRRVLVAGPQCVATAPRFRGRRLSICLLDAALAAARKQHAQHGLLFCLPELEPLYASVGWRTLKQPMVMRAPSGRALPLPEKNIGMAIALTDEPFPHGPVDLMGPDW